MCPTESATYRILGFKLKLDLAFGTFGFEVDGVGGKSVGAGFEFVLRCVAVEAGFEDGVEGDFDAGFVVFFVKHHNISPTFCRTHGYFVIIKFVHRNVCSFLLSVYNGFSCSFAMIFGVIGSVIVIQCC